MLNANARGHLLQPAAALQKKNTDPNHCGTCSNKCPEGWKCKDGNCFCPQGFFVCPEGTCVPNAKKCNTTCVVPAPPQPVSVTNMTYFQRQGNNRTAPGRAPCPAGLGCFGKTAMPQCKTATRWASANLHAIAQQQHTPARMTFRLDMHWYTHQPGLKLIRHWHAIPVALNRPLAGVTMCRSRE